MPTKMPRAYNKILFQFAFQKEQFLGVPLCKGYAFA
jgi:hypothetical protein